jgi:L-lactate dehydrogenase complex protein LldE
MTHYPDKPDNAYYFGTCLMDMFYPQAGMAGIKLIQSGRQRHFPAAAVLLRSTCI